jgi:rubrerythrin
VSTTKSESRARADESPDRIAFAASGEAAAGAFRCAECGYGVTVRRALPLCPMCGGTAWQHPSYRTAWARVEQRPLL